MIIWFCLAGIDILRMIVLHPNGATLFHKHIESDNGMYYQEVFFQLPSSYILAVSAWVCKQSQIFVSEIFVIFKFDVGCLCALTAVLMETLAKVTTTPQPANLLTIIRLITNLFKHSCFTKWLQSHCSQVQLFTYALVHQILLGNSLLLDLLNGCNNTCMIIYGICCWTYVYLDMP